MLIATRHGGSVLKAPYGEPPDTTLRIMRVLHNSPALLQSESIELLNMRPDGLNCCLSSPVDKGLIKFGVVFARA